MFSDLILFKSSSHFLYKGMFLAKFESIRFNRNIIEFYKCSLREGGIFARKVSWISNAWIIKSFSNCMQSKGASAIFSSIIHFKFFSQATALYRLKLVSCFPPIHTKEHEKILDKSEKEKTRISCTYCM